MKDTLVAPDEPLTRPHIEARDAARLARKEDLPEVHPQGAEGMIFGVYQDWVQQNHGKHMEGGITEDGKWQDMWKNLSVCLPNATTHRMGKLEDSLSQPSHWSLNSYKLGSGTTRG